MSKPVYSITPFTMLDFPDRTACIVWFAGCNMRCRYCYNIDIVRGKGYKDYREVLEFLRTRTGLLDGVVLSGGECTMHQRVDGFMEQVRELGFEIKLDTNGSNPRKLKDWLERGWLSYVALDFKALPEYFYKITQSDLFRRFEKSLDVLMASGRAFEVRTTIHSSLFNADMIQEMIAYLERKKYKGPYYLQNFMNDCPTLGNLDRDWNSIKSGEFNSRAFEVLVRN